MTATDYGGDYEISNIKVYQFNRWRIGSAEYFESFLVNINNGLFLEKLKAIGIDPGSVAVCHVHDFMHYIQYAIVLKRLNPSCLTLVHHHFAGFYDLKIGKLGIFPVWSYLLYRKMRREFASVDAHVFISEHCRRCYGHNIDFQTGEDRGILYGGFELTDSYVWYNGVDTETFRAPLSRNSHPFTVGCVGNFHPCKRQLDLVKAFEIVLKSRPDARLKLVGEGVKKRECEEYVKVHAMGKQVEFLKSMPHERLPEYYHNTDLLVMPSINEGFCCVNVEANYCGTPFIAIKGLPAEEILSDESKNVWLVLPRDVEGLAEKILAFAHSPQKQTLSIDLDANILARKFVDWTFKKRKFKP